MLNPRSRLGLVTILAQWASSEERGHHKLYPVSRFLHGSILIQSGESHNFLSCLFNNRPCFSASLPVGAQSILIEWMNELTWSMWWVMLKDALQWSYGLTGTYIIEFLKVITFPSWWPRQWLCHWKCSSMWENDSIFSANVCSVLALNVAIILAHLHSIFGRKGKRIVGTFCNLFINFQKLKEPWLLCSDFLND